jgi:hypothetical protein
MYKRIEALKDRLPKEHQDMAILTQHIFEALDQLREKHRQLVGTSAVAKIKPNGQAEKTFYETITEAQQLIMTTLEYTTEDIEHRGDKYWEKWYPQGVDPTTEYLYERDKY